MALRRRQVPRVTPRQVEVLQLLADGQTAKEIAAALTISPESVRTHLRRAIHALGAKNRPHVVAVALRARLIK